MDEQFLFFCLLSSLDIESLLFLNTVAFPARCGLSIQHGEWGGGGGGFNETS